MIKKFITWLYVRYVVMENLNEAIEEGSVEVRYVKAVDIAMIERNYNTLQ